MNKLPPKSVSKLTRLENQIILNKLAPFREVLKWLAIDLPPIRLTELRDFLLAVENRRHHEPQLRAVFAELARLAFPHSLLGEMVALFFPTQRRLRKGSRATVRAASAGRRVRAETSDQPAPLLERL